MSERDHAQVGEYTVFWNDTTLYFEHRERGEEDSFYIFLDEDDSNTARRPLMKYQAVRELRAQQQAALDNYRERYERLVEESKHDLAAVVKGQISRQCGKLDGIDQTLEVLNG